MPFFDMPLSQLEIYQPVRKEPSDFDAFWDQTLTQARNYDLNARFEPVNHHLAYVDTFDVTFNGYNGQPIKGWLLLPKNRQEPLPCIVEYIGYGGGRGFAIDWLYWSSLGYAHLIMDTRGQGSVWQKGDTPDIADVGDNPQHPGFMTRGIMSPQSYYYRRVFTDAVRTVEVALSHDAIDNERIFVCGGSQGGGISLAVSGLVAGLAGVMPDVPFLCHYRRAVEITGSDPYNEIRRWLKVHRNAVDTVFDTLSYFDGLNFATRATAPTLFSVGLMDLICPPSTVYAAYNYYGGDKQIRVYEFNDHEGGQVFQRIEQTNWVREQLGA